MNVLKQKKLIPTYAVSSSTFVLGSRVLRAYGYMTSLTETCERSHRTGVTPGLHSFPL
jgi:hypothetical protein